MRYRHPYDNNIDYLSNNHRSVGDFKIIIKIIWVDMGGFMTIDMTGVLIALISIVLVYMILHGVWLLGNNKFDEMEQPDLVGRKNIFKAVDADLERLGIENYRNGGNDEK